MELRKRCTLDVSHVGDGDDHFIVGIEVFRIEFFRSIHDFRTAVVTVFLFYFNQFILDYFLAKFLVAQDFFEVSNLFHQILVFSMQLILHQSGELAQTHFHNGAGLHLAQVEAGHQVGNCLVRSLGRTDNADYLVDIVGSDDQTFQNVCTFLGLAQVVTCTANHHLMTVFHEIFNQVLQVEQTRTTVNQRHVVHTE